MARPATNLDAADAIDAVRRSIITLCEPDHRNDPATLGRWLDNKKPESFAQWLANPDNFCVVEEVDGRVQGVGLLHASGELRLFYVAPGQERRGLGRRIHEALVAQAARWGLTTLHLQSTSVARRFYESLGYRAAGAEVSLFGVLKGFPYEMTLQPAGIDRLIARFFAAFDNRAGRIPTHQEFDELFIRGAVIVQSAAGKTSVLSVAEFAEPRIALLTSGKLREFHEWETTSSTQVVAGFATRTSRYEKSGLLDSKSYAGVGTKLFQLVKIDGQWRIVSLCWYDS